MGRAVADAYNHNINTAESFHDNIMKTHTYEDRTNTVEHAKAAGLSPCSGLIVGLGDYLTAEGQAAADDFAMIRDNGFTILGQEGGEARTEEPVAGCGGEAGCCSDRQTTAEAAAHTDPVIRRRGAGTAEVANA